MKTPSRTLVSLCLLACLQAGLTLLLSLDRLYSYKASLLDSGVFDQLLWNMAEHGQPFSTINFPYTVQHWLGFHFSPLLLALVPLYKLWPTPETLQVVQSLCIAISAVPLFYAALRITGERRVAWACAVLFWLNPFVLSAAIWDFHEVALACPLMALAFWALSAKRFGWFVASLMLLLLTKEHYGLSVAGFGFLWGWRHGQWKRGLAVSALGLLALYVVLGIIMPHFHGGTHAMLSASGTHLDRFGWLSLPWPQKLAAFSALFWGDGGGSMSGAAHLLLLLVSSLLLPLLAPFYLAPALGDLAANLLSTNPMLRHIAAYHALTAVPAFVIAAAQGYSYLMRRRPDLRKAVQIFALSIALILPLSGLTFFPITIWELKFAPPTHDRDIRAAIRSMLGEEPVSAQANIGMFFSQRVGIYPFPHKLDKSTRVVLYLRHPFRDPASEHFNIPYGSSTQEFLEAAMEVMDGNDWSVEYWEEPWLVLRRRPTRLDELHTRENIRFAIRELQSALNKSLSH